nr:hypothetical protein [Bacilli bacterium]
MITNTHIEKFVLYLRKVIFEKEYINDFETLKKIKYYLHDHKDNKEVIKAKTFLADYLYNIYTSKELVNALNTSDSYRYLRKLHIFNEDPVRKYPELIDFFNQTIFIPEGSYKEDNISWFLEDMGYKVPDTLSILKEFGTKNKFPSKDNTYGTLEQDKFRYLQMKKNIMTDDYNEFVKDKEASSAAYNHYYEGNPVIDYINKKLGNIGEMHLLDELKGLGFNASLVARDLGNGLGYDIYTQATIESRVKEVLIEVKSTSDLNKDTFSITTGEQNVMKDTIDNINALYMVILSHIDVEKNIYNSDYFIAKDEKTFIKYGTDEEYVFTEFDNNCNLVFENKKNIKTK